MSCGKKILIVEHEAALLDRIADGLVRHLDAQITCVADERRAIEADLFDPHDLVILEGDLPGGRAAELVGRLSGNGVRPVLVLWEAPRACEVISALRGGAFDVLPKPFSKEALIESVRRALAALGQRQAVAARYRKMRELVRRVVRERRDLDRRIELVCRDLVEAHRRLTHRFVELRKAQSAAG